MSEHRFNTLQNWLASTCSTSAFELSPLAGDASFRRYFRLGLPDRKLIVMDAPPAKENIQPFIAIAKAWAANNIQVPQIEAYDLTQGFMLLSDLGDDLYFNLLNNQSVDELYTKALAVLLQIQACNHKLQDWELPHFNEHMIGNELNLFLDWFLIKHLNLTIATELSKMLEEVFVLLIQSALEQPQVCVHRDYHSRNLLLLKNGDVGVLDFQDAVCGPITYDVISLLRDCYIVWPQAQVEKWALLFYNMLNTKAFSQDQYLRWFDLMSMQRHIKVLGIFARLCYRDNKPNYINDFPRILNYLINVSEKYPEFSRFNHFLNTAIAPHIKGV